MTSDSITIRQAIEGDLEGILLLQAANQINVGGTLSASLPGPLIREIIRSMPVIVAIQESKLVGFLFISTKEINADIPIVQAMLVAYPVQPEIMISGPICVSEEVRGRGLAHRLFQELGRIRPGLQCVCFIRKDNLQSIRAHIKMGMIEVGSFVFNNSNHGIFTYTVS